MSDIEKHPWQPDDPETYRARERELRRLARRERELLNIIGEEKPSRARRGKGIYSAEAEYQGWGGDKG